MAALDPIITIDGGGIIQSASDSAERVLGWTPSELIGRNVNILMPEPYHSAHDGYLATYHRTGRTNIMNRPRRFEALHRDGTRVPIELCVSRADVPGGGAPLFVGIIRDMSEHAAAERSRDEERARSQQLLAEQTSALQQAHVQLRMADRMASIGTLAAGLGHDMNNVLLPVRARLNALIASAQAGALPAPDRKHVEEIKKSIAYLQQLADGLHFLAMDPESEGSEHSGEEITDLRHWWSQVGALLSRAVPKHVRVFASFPAVLPPVAVPSHGLTQAVLNLVVNAGEAIPAAPARKRRQGAVRITARADGDQVRLGVADNGSGMTDEVLRRCFEMFFTTKPRGLGTGLGLALVRKVVSRAGGRVSVESAVGSGTTIILHLPAARPFATGAEDGAPAAAISIPDGRAAGLLRHLLETSGIAVKPAQDHARIWILDPAVVRPEPVRSWLAARPGGRVVLWGRPGPDTAGTWDAVAPITIESTDDLEAVRAAIRHALSPVSEARDRAQAPIQR